MKKIWGNKYITKFKPRQIQNDSRRRGGRTDGEIQHKFTPSTGCLKLFISANKLICKPEAAEQKGVMIYPYLAVYRDFLATLKQSYSPEWIKPFPMWGCQDWYLSCPALLQPTIAVAHSWFSFHPAMPSDKGWSRFPFPFQAASLCEILGKCSGT